jgi:hypothetical protein
MKWNLWLDDQINDPDAENRWTPENYVGAESSDAAIHLVQKFGPPELMDLDHDLGEGDDAMIFLKWLSDNYYDQIPGYVVHSSNPVGRKNIISFMESWRKSIY